VKRKWLTTNGMQYNWGTICASIELEMSEYCLQAAHCLGIILWLGNMSTIEYDVWKQCESTMLWLAINNEQK